MRPLQLPALAAALAVLAVGCASLPESSAATVLRKVPLVGRIAEQPNIRQDVPPPPQDGRPDEIVAGFFTALTVADQGHDRARAFLTRQERLRWRDDAQVIVTENAPAVGKPDAAQRVPVTFRPVGVVHRDGSYQPATGPAADRVSWLLPMSREFGQWRIAGLPKTAGVVLSLAQFERIYQAFPVYFLDPSGQRVVPDPRYLSSDSQALPTQLVQALLAGPSDWLAPVARSALGAPVSLLNVTVGIDRVVSVDMSGLNLLPETQRRLALAQLAWTLTSQLVVTGMRITSDGRPVDLPEAQRPVSFTAFGGFDPDAAPSNVTVYFVRDGAVFTLDGRRLPGPAGRGGYRLDSVAISDDQLALAGVADSPGGDTLYLGPLRAALDPVLSARSLSRPTWDRASSSFWVVRDGTQVVQVTLDGRIGTVGLDRGNLVGPIGAVRMSRDGVRVAVLAGLPGGQRLYVGRVRSRVAEGGRPVTVVLEAMRQIGGGLVDVRDVAWASSVTLDVVGREASGKLAVWQVPVDGAGEPEPFSLGGLPGPPVAVAAADNLTPVVEAASGTLWVRGSQLPWVSPQHESTVPGHDPTYPG